MLEGRRIGIDIRSLRPPRTGTGVYLDRLLSELIELEPETRWIGYSASPIPELRARLPALETRSGTGPMTRSGHLWLQVAAPRAAVEDGLDLFWGPLQVLPLRLLGRLPTIVSLHDLVFRRFPETMAWRDRLASRLLVMRSLRRADRVIAVSRTTADAAVELGVDPARLRVVHNGVDPAFSPGDAAEASALVRRRWGFDGEYLLFVGTFEPRKNLIGLLDAVTELVERGRFDGTVLLVGGAGWGSSGIEERLARPALARRVVRAGFVEAEDLPGLYRGARLFVLPSLYEGFGLPVLEAMASGTPVVCSRREPFPEVAGQAAVLADLEPGGLAAAIDRAWHDEELRARLRRQGLVRARDFGWRRSAERLREVMAELVPERSPQ